MILLLLMQMSSKVCRKRLRDVQHSHTQTHGTNRKLRRITSSQPAGVNVVPVDTETPQWWTSDVRNQAALWPDVATNATQTVSPLATKLESIRTQTVESFLSSSQQEDLLNIATQLLSDGVGSSREDSSSFVVHSNTGIGNSSASDTLLASISKPAASSENGDFLQPGILLNDISSLDITQTFQQQEPSASGVFGVNCVGSQTLDPLVDELMNVVDDARGQGLPSSSELSRVMLTSASQTMPDFDAVSTQTMDCDFDIDDFIHTETQTTDMLASYFSFADIETQTANDLQYWDCETQTCFDALLSPSHL